MLGNQIAPNNCPHPFPHHITTHRLLIRTGIDVGLVHLIGDKDELLLLAELDDGVLVLAGEHASGRVAWVDDHERPHCLAILPCLHSGGGLISDTTQELANELEKCA